jgi:hypothetical protein
MRLAQPVVDEAGAQALVEAVGRIAPLRDAQRTTVSGRTAWRTLFVYGATAVRRQPS